MPAAQTYDKFKAALGIAEMEVIIKLRMCMLQAIHIPHACLGNISTARELFDRASKCAFDVGKAETIFCVKTYSYLPVEEFQKVNTGMLTALDANQLWDGMPLPKVE